MTSAYTSLLGLALPVDGELTGTWGQTVNDYITTYLDGAVAGTQIISGTQTAVTLSKTTGTALIQVGPSGTTGSSQYQVIKCSGTPSSLLTVTVPSAEKTYLVINATSQSVKIVGAGPTTGVTIASGKTSIVAWNGSDFVEISPSTATTATTATTANALNSATTTVVVNASAAPTNGQVLTATSGTAASWQPPTSGVSLSAANTWTGTQTFSGSTSTLGAVLTNAAEVTTVSATAATGTINYDVTTQSVLYYTTSASANWTVNVRASSGTTLNTALATGQSITLAFMVTQGATAYYNSAFTIDGTSVTPKWQGGTAPTAGNASGIDVYTYTITKTASATYTVLASLTQFK